MSVQEVVEWIVRHESTVALEITVADEFVLSSSVNGCMVTSSTSATFECCGEDSVAP